MKPNYLTSPTVWTLALGAFLFTVLLIPFAMRLAHRLGAVDRGGHRSIYSGKPMPLLGGLAIGIPFITICFFGLLPFSNMFETIEHHRHGLIALGFGCGGILLLGAIDDIVGLGARAKFAGQLLAATLTCLAGYNIKGVDLPFYGHIAFEPVAGIGLTLLWIVGLTNAYNLIDGMDGLATGLALIAGIGLGAISLLNGSTFPVLMCVAFSASLVGFLIFNFHPARIFLGDTGSMLLGFILANITLMGSLKASGAVIFLAPVLVLGLPIMDTLISLLRRYLRGRPLFRGDQGHLHHRLLKKGYSQRESALIFYGIATVMTASAVASWALPIDSPLVWLTSGCYVMAVVTVIVIADLGPPVLFQMVKCHRRNMLLSALSRYVNMRLNEQLNPSKECDERILWFICEELSLRSLIVESESGEKLLAFDRSVEIACEPNAEPVQRIKVRIANKQIVYLGFQSEKALDELTKTDIEACLASIFDRISLRPAGRAVPATALHEAPAD